MALTLDLRAPIIILVARFNASIFEPAWIARHLFDKNEGDDMEMVEVVAQNSHNVLQLIFFEGVAFRVTPERTEIFVLDGNPATFTRVEELLVKMLEVLPHTPLAAIGCNLTFLDDDPSATVTNLFETREQLEGEGELNLLQSGVQLVLNDSEVLNFNRILTEANARFTFNYHRSESDIDLYKEFIPGLITKSLDHSKQLLHTYYTYGEPDVMSFSTNAEQEDINDANQGTS